METVELKYQYTKSEYVRASRQYLIASKTIHKYDGVLVAVFLLLAIGCLFLSSFSAFSIFVLVIVLVATAMGSYVYFLMPGLTFKHTAKYHEEYRLVFSKENICFKTPSIDSKLKWNNYPELWENNDFYFMIQAPRMYSIIPKRVFKDKNEKQIFDEIIKSNYKTIKRI